MATAPQPESSPPAKDRPQFPPKRPVGVIVKSLGAILMLVSLLGILFFAWYFSTLSIGPVLLLLGWVGGFILFIVGRNLE